MVLGQSRGKEVRVMVHHSRNSEQKQWDETVVIALGGMARLLRAHLPAIVGMDRVAGGELGWVHWFRDCWLLAALRAVGPEATSASLLWRAAAKCARMRIPHVLLPPFLARHNLHSRTCLSAAGWEEMMIVVESSMAGGRKEVALAAIALLAAVLAAHGSITDIVTPAMWKRAVRAVGVGVEAATSPACMVPLMVRLLG